MLNGKAMSVGGAGCVAVHKLDKLRNACSWHCVATETVLENGVDCVEVILYSVVLSLDSGGGTKCRDTQCWHGPLQVF